MLNLIESSQQHSGIYCHRHFSDEEPEVQHVCNFAPEDGTGFLALDPTLCTVSLLTEEDLFLLSHLEIPQCFIKVLTFRLKTAKVETQTQTPQGSELLEA